MRNWTEFCKEYAPYNKFPEFEEGANDYLSRNWKNYDGVKGQAYDRGLEAAMRFNRGE